MQLPGCGSDVCLAADVTFRLIHDIARCTVDVVVVGKRALTHCTFKLWYSLAAAEPGLNRKQEHLGAGFLE